MIATERTTPMNTNKTLSEIIAELTPAEREVVMKSTLGDWLNALGELVRDPGFWQGIGQAFLAGAIEGVQEFVDDQD